MTYIAEYIQSQFAIFIVNPVEGVLALYSTKSIK